MKTRLAILSSLIWALGCSNPLGSKESFVDKEYGHGEPAAGPVISYSGAAGTSTNIGMTALIAPTELQSNGSGITSCLSDPALPAGLNIHATTCVISGIPTTVSAAVDYTITASNAAGSATALVTLSVAASVPAISYTGSSGTSGIIGASMSISPTLLLANGANITQCTSGSALPAGLNIDATTCVISGTPTVVASATSYTITATNAAGSASATVTLTVAAKAPTLSFAGATGTSGVVGTSFSVTPTTLIDNGAVVQNCTVNPALPAGLSIAATTCVISGTPTAVASAASYTITVSNSAGSSSDSVTLSVAAAVPTLSFAGATGTSGVLGTAMSVSPTTLLANGAAVSNCVSSPALPSGLSLNTSTCVISGTPNAVSSSASYTITATNSAGATSASVTLSVAATVPSLSYVGAVGTSGIVGTAMSIVPTTLLANGAAISNCVSNPALSSGLSIAPTTCVISGTPNVSLPATAYTVTVTNSVGSSTASLNIQIESLCPAGYLRVPHNIAFGTSADFCVAKYEMKNVANVATSQAAGPPWVSISQENSIIQCGNLGARYALMTNEEAMTIARNVELVHSNWSSGTAGVGVLARGHSDTNPNNTIEASTDDEQGYINTGNNSGQAANSGWEQRRTLKLSTGDVIWDFAGNVWEWVQWQVTPAKKAYVSSDTVPVSNFRDWKAVNMLIGQGGGDEMLPAKWASSFIQFSGGVPLAASLDGNNGLGQYWAGANNSGGTARRGGGFDNVKGTGVFALSLLNASNVTGGGLGFRCVYHP